MRDYEHRNACKTRQILLLILLLNPFLTSHLGGSPQDTIINVGKGSYLQIKDFKSFIGSDTSISIPSSLVRVSVSARDRSITFYDSLKAKAAKSKITRTLFDLVIVSPDSGSLKMVNRKSDEVFAGYSGLRIRNINIQRLNVFGADISNPSLYNPKKLEKVLNSTHVNTTENIIRKNLLFSEGDTVSSLTLTDNERILRQLPFIDDAKIVVVPVSEEEADIYVISKDVYSLGADFTYRGKDKGSVWLFDKNIFGMGHEFRVEVPYSAESQDSPGIGLDYIVNNISKSFVNLNLRYYNALDVKTYGINAYRNLVGSETKYAGGISIRRTETIEDLDTLPAPVPLKYTYQDYWLQRSFLLSRSSVLRLIAGARYVNNNVFEKPEISPDTYYSLQKYKLFLGSVSLSMQKYYKTNLLYSYGRTEDIPYGGIINLTAGSENNEFKNRVYLSADASFGISSAAVGYFNFSSGIGTFLRNGASEQGVASIKMIYFSNLLSLGRYMMRNFINVDYTRGFDRYDDEYLKVIRSNGFSGFRNDSVQGAQRVNLSLESVIFSPANFYGFRFAVFGFADMQFLAGTNEILADGRILSSVGIGLRIRNDNLVFSTFQIRLGYFPSPPAYSKITSPYVSGEQLLRPRNFDPQPPSLMNYR